MQKPSEWLLCPNCHGKTRIKVRYDTKLERFPLFCPKCKLETLIFVEHLQLKMDRKC